MVIMAAVSTVRLDGYLVKNPENNWIPESRPWHLHDTSNPDFVKIPTHHGLIDVQLHYSYGVVK